MYIGETENLKRRIYQHKNKAHPTTFSARYNLDTLVNYTEYDTKEDAKLKEKQMKKWNRAWKVELIEKTNSEWKDLYNNL